mmetsp:Transcript_64961/g.184298  ORF Transcript_64961/g.184298 Transcript_64961/m.184298 type:complete len:232 (+) Transcript_64961:1991-2686(+)
MKARGWMWVSRRARRQGPLACNSGLLWKAWRCTRGWRAVPGQSRASPRRAQQACNSPRAPSSLMPGRRPALRPLPVCTTSSPWSAWRWTRASRAASSGPRPGAPWLMHPPARSSLPERRAYSRRQGPRGQDLPGLGPLAAPQKRRLRKASTTVWPSKTLRARPSTRVWRAAPGACCSSALCSWARRCQTRRSVRCRRCALTMRSSRAAPSVWSRTSAASSSQRCAAATSST